jgi:hypothetical protein
MMPFWDTVIVTLLKRRNYSDTFEVPSSSSVDQEALASDTRSSTFARRRVAPTARQQHMWRSEILHEMRLVTAQTDTSV